MQPAPSRVWRERVGERVALWAARIYFYLKPQSHPHPNLPPPDGGRNKVADTVKGCLKFKAWFQTTFFNNQTSANTPPPSFPRRRESTFKSRRLFLNIGFLEFAMDSRLRGNDGSWAEIYAITCNLPPLPSGGRGLGRGWLYGLHEFDFASSREATPILTFPRQTGEGTRLLLWKKVV